MAIDNNLFAIAYKNKKDMLEKNIFLHQYPSPYLTESDRGAQKSSNLLGQSKNLANKIYTSNNINFLRTKERAKMDLMRIELERAVSEKTVILSQPPSDFIEYCRYFNRLYKVYVSQQLGNSGLLTSYGQYVGDSFYKKEEIQKIEQEIFRDFNTIFLDEYFESAIDNKESRKIKSDIKQIIKNEGAESIIGNFKTMHNKILETLEREIVSFSGDNISDQINKIIYEQWKKNMEQWVISRGLNYIAKIYEEATKDNPKDRNKNLTYGKLKAAYGQGKINNVEKPNYHTSNEKISGSFDGYIHSERRFGAIGEKGLELILNSLFNTEYSITKGKAKVSGADISKTTGRQIKGDVILECGGQFTIQKQLKGKEITIEKPDEQKGNIIKFSVKNYKDTGSVKVHSSGKIETITNYLSNGLQNLGRTKAPQERFYRELKSPITKYYLVNEGYPDERKNSEFNKVFKEVLSYFGGVFALGQFLNDNEFTADNVDFIVINNNIIPGSLVIEKMFEVINPKENETPTPVGNIVSTAINYPVYKDPHYPPLGDIESADQLYSEEVVNKGHKKGKNLAEHITFTISIYSSFRRALQNLLSKIEE